jgi:hypothetical protein
MIKENLDLTYSGYYQRNNESIGNGSKSYLHLRPIPTFNHLSFQLSVPCKSQSVPASTSSNLNSTLNVLKYVGCTSVVNQTVSYTSFNILQ